MEALMVGKPQSVAIGVMRALIEPMLAHWGRTDEYIREGMEILGREGGGALYDEKKSPAQLEALLHKVTRAWATYFRPIQNPVQLEHLHRELDQNAAKIPSTYQQGVLWLAHRLQGAAIEYLNSPSGADHRAQVLSTIVTRGAALAKPLIISEQLTLGQIEEVLVRFARAELPGALGGFQLLVLAGHLLESVRAATRKAPVLDGGEEEPEDNQGIGALLSVLSGPVRVGEVNEARMRYTRLDDGEKQRRYNDFRLKMLRIVKTVAPFATMGFDEFCLAIEASLFPYPEMVEYIRTFARAIHDNGAKSTIFDGIQTRQAVEQRYENLAGSRQVNLIVLEVAKAFAMAAFRRSALEGKKAYLREVNLKEEFGWPGSISDLLEQLG